MSKHDIPRAYPLSMTDAVELSGATPGQLRDFARAGLLPCLTERAPGGEEWFNPDDLAEVKLTFSTIANAPTDERRVHNVGEALRRYLEARPPLADYDAALESGSPVLARSKSGTTYAHVHPQVLADWADVHCPDLPASWILGPVRAALKLLGAAQVRGIRPVTGGDQRWHTWYRLPVSIWAATPEVQTLLQGLGGAREFGEKTRGIGDEATLADRMNVL